jgi:HK97 family phage prohead protease
MEGDNSMDKNFLDFPFEVKELDKDGTIRGYGSTFGGKPDAHRDIVLKGAFVETLANGGRNGNGIPMLWQHDSSQAPPGVWTSLSEDSKGLRSEGKLALETSLGKDVYEIMKLGMETKTFQFGQSIGYDAVEYEFDEKKKIRKLKKIDLWELSIVTFPANINARVETVKAIEQLTIKMFEDATTERELEKALREAGSSKGVSRFLVKLYRPYLREANKMSGGSGLFDMLDTLSEANAGLKKDQLEDEPGGMLGILKTLKDINS